MLTLLFGAGTGALLALAGFLTHRYAPRVGPNPWFGARFPGTFASREAWDWGNRIGMLLAGVGAGLAAASIVLAALGVPGEAAIVSLSIALVLALACVLLWLARATGRRAKETGTKPSR